MDPLVQRRNKLLIRLPLVAAVAVALFWGVWRLVAGTVPSVFAITLDGETSYLLPFTVSRGLDIPAAAAFAALAVMAWYVMRRTEKDDITVAAIVIAIAIVAGFTFIAVTGFAADVTAGVILITIVTAGAAIFIALAYEYAYAGGAAISVFGSIVLALGIGLGSAIMFGGVVGLAIAVGLAVAYAALSMLVFNAVYGARLLVRHRNAVARGCDTVARGCVNWLLARDIGKGQ